MPNSTSTGDCAKCGTSNEYSQINCGACGARLPWARITNPASSQQMATQPFPDPQPGGCFFGALKLLLPFAEMVNKREKEPHLSVIGMLAVIVGIIGIFYYAFMFQTYEAIVQLGQALLVVSPERVGKQMGGIAGFMVVALFGGYEIYKKWRI